MIRSIVLAAATTTVLAGCGDAAAEVSTSGTSEGAKPVVVTDIYPTTFAVAQVAGNAVDIVQLAPAGVEPHDYELTQQQVAQIASADLVAYLPGMIPAVQDSVEQQAGNKVVDVAGGITMLPGHHDGEDGDHEGHHDDSEEGDSAAHSDGEEHTHEWDPHVWLNPSNMTTMGENVADALAQLNVAADPSALTQEMNQLNEEFTTTLANCTITPMVVNHEAFGYLAAAYGFEQIGISGLSPDAQPSPARMAEITELVTREGVTTIYFESLASPATAETIARETGATTALLDPIEGNTDDAGYPAIMRTNMNTLKTGQACS